MKCFPVILLFGILNYTLYSVEPDETYAILWERATSYSLNHQNEDAIKVINILIAAYPRDELLYVKRSGEYSRLKRFDLALLDVNKALEISPKNIDALGALALIKIELNDVKGGLDVWRKVDVSDKNSDYYKMMYYCSDFNIMVLAGEIENAKKDIPMLIKYRDVHGKMAEWLAADRQFDKVRSDKWFVDLVHGLTNR